MKKPIQIYKNLNFGKFDVMKVSRILNEKVTMREKKVRITVR